jgi:hypothetical protein
MADKGGRTGGIGLFIMGLLIGVVGTLVTQKIIMGGSEHGNTLPASTTIVPAPEPGPDSDAKPKLVVHPGGLSSAKPRSAAAAAVEQNPADVADDAAAAGMTSRTPRQTPPQN